jgi:hypothetical protein
MYAAKLVHTRRALSSTIINSHQRQFQVKPAALLIPITRKRDGKSKNISACLIMHFRIDQLSVFPNSLLSS